MLLDGHWRAAPVTPLLTRVGADDDLDDSDWAEVPIPGHWAQHSDFVDTSGPVLFRHRFDAPLLGPKQRSWLRLEGVMGHSDVWLDGSYLGSTTGYFVPHSFESTRLHRQNTNHCLSIEVACPSPTRHGNQVLTGSIQAGPLRPPGNPGGIWRPVSAETTGPVAIMHSRLICERANEESAEVSIRLVLDSLEACDIRVNTSVTGPDGESVTGGTETHTLASGENRIEWKQTIANPELWWPADLGDQPLYEIGVAVVCDDDTAATSDHQHWRVGLRNIKVDNMVWWVNGVRLFAKGIALGPQSPHLATVGANEARRDLEAVRSAGLNMVRVFGHIAPPALYEQADELGLLVWQDMPLLGELSVATRRPAKKLARSMVDLLGHHASIALWCAHVEPNGSVLPEPGTTNEETPSVSKRVGRHLLPSWSRTILDPQLRRELHAADRSRTTLTHSGRVPGVVEIGSADPSLWLGWHVGLAENLAGVLARWPRLGGFLSGFGSQSVPIRDWPADSPRFSSAQQGPFARYLPRRAYSNGRAWARATQAYQADLLKTQIETIRRIKYRPSGGFCLMALADSDPSGGFGILEFDREGKTAFSSVVDACRPVVVVADQPPQLVAPGDLLKLNINSISDLTTDLDEVEVTATASLGEWSVTQSWRGHLNADTCSFVGTLTLKVPELNGAMIIDIDLVADGAAATNRYQTVVIPASEAGTKPRTRIGG